MLEALDIIIGLALVFTLVSLLCSMVNEWIAGLLAQRGRMLWRGIENLVSKDVADDLCRHQLLQGLAHKTWFDSLARFFTLGKFDRSKPAYLPADLFVTTLLDVLGGRVPAAPAGGGGGGGAPPAAGAAAAAGPAPAAPALPAAPAAPAAAAPPGWLRLVERLLKWLRPAAPAPAVAAAVGGAMPTDYPGLRAAVIAIADIQVRNALLALVDGVDPALPQAFELAKAEIGKWFDAGMDRVTGLYKRWTQLVLLAIGLVVSLSYGIDSLQILSALESNPQLRDAMVIKAREYVASKNGSESSEASTGTKGSTGTAGTTGTNGTTSGKSTAAPQNGTPAPAAQPAGGDATPVHFNRAKFKEAQQELAGLKLPLAPYNSVEMEAEFRCRCVKNEGELKKCLEIRQEEIRAFDRKGCITPVCKSDGTLITPILNEVPCDKAPPKEKRSDGDPSDKRLLLRTFANTFWPRWLWPHLSGFILTAIAASLGAPFWFDLLSKVTNLRTSLKPPQEKTGKA